MSDSMIAKAKVAIGVVTYRREARLRRLLDSLDGLAFRCMREPRIRVVVVDNDPEKSAEAVVANAPCRYETRYCVESRRGVSFARNTAIAGANGSDFLAFIDDDEEASPEWLENLLLAQTVFDAAIVAGPVISRFENQPPRWVVKGGYCERKRHATGTRLISAGAGNVLISKRVLQATSPTWFDPRFALTGGEDTQYFRRCAAKGWPVTWADNAIVYETLPPSRFTEGSLVARARNGGNHWTRVDLELQPTFGKLLSRFAIGGLRVLQGAGMHMANPVVRAEERLKGRLRMAEGMGNLDAFFGRSRNIYGGEDR